MVSAVGMQHRHIPQMPAKAQQTVEAQEIKGKSLDSVGHRAKEDVAALTDPPANAQGKAAALIASLGLSALTPEQPAEFIEVESNPTAS